MILVNKKILITAIAPATLLGVFFTLAIAGCAPSQIYDQNGEIIYINKPPQIKGSSDNLVIQDMFNNILVYGKLVSKSPVTFSNDSYREITYWYSLDCRARPEGNSLVVCRPNATSYINESVTVEEGDIGFFWINSEQCRVDYFQKEVDDHVLVTSSQEVFYRGKVLMFKGELVDLIEDVAVNEYWDMRHKYLARVDTVYLNLCNFSLNSPIETEIIGWIPPKRGPLYFWGGVLPDNHSISCYISSEPRAIWFTPTSGRYEIKILTMEEADTYCGCSGCSTSYLITGEVINTQQGLVQTGKTIQFYYEDPSFTVGSEHIFVGNVTGNYSSFNYSLQLAE